MGRRTGGGTRGDDGAVQARLGDNVDLDGRVATRVVDVAGVDLADRHDSNCVKVAVEAS